MHTLIFATNNNNKVAEVKNMLDDSFNIISLADAGIEIDIPEPHDTLEANAKEKSGTIYKLTGKNCFGEDTGLEVVALHGAPGVKSARYAGEGRSSEDNIDKLLLDLSTTADRSARFRTVISLIFEGNNYTFEGICEGRIEEKRRGTQGFGYDSVFVPKKSEKTFGEMDMKEKATFSHRRNAMDKLISFLKNIK